MKLSKLRVLAFTAISSMLFFTACKKDDVARAGLNVVLTAKDSVITGKASQYFSITATVISGTDVKHEWTVNDSVYSRNEYFTISPKASGIYTIIYKATSAEGTQINRFTLNVGLTIRPVAANSSKYINHIFEFMPAPGQFINESLGSPAGTLNLIGKSGSLVSLGGYGGYVVFGFDHSVINNTGMDLAVFGNPVTGSSPWSEPGIVQVMQDVNGNGLPDDQWYELAGSEHDSATTIKNYSITYYNPNGLLNVPWKDNQGKTGAVMYNTFHRHNYYPLFVANQDSITFKGTLLRSTFTQRGLFVSDPFEWGYSDNGSADYVSMATPKYNSFDLNWAIDKTGKKVTLGAIDFVKVMTGQNSPGNALMGEISTEVAGAMDLNIK